MSITVKMFRLFKNCIQFKSNLRIVCYHSYNNNSLLELFANKTKQTIIRTPQLLSSSQLQWQCRRCLPSWGPPKPPVDKNEVAARVVKTLGSHDKIDKSILTTSSHFIEDLSLDSLDVIELVMKIEDEFKIEISDVDAEKMLKVSDVIDYCIRVLEEQVDDLQRPSIEYLVGEVDKK